MLAFVEIRKSGHSMSRSSGYCCLVSNLDTQIDCLAEVLIMVAGSDFEMLEVQLTASVIVEH